ncbi:MAG: PaaI family thioesterase [Actinobacteria bacterium]|nr:PaaI family thioesterase [Actinomycetota bacterium]
MGATHSRADFGDGIPHGAGETTTEQRIEFISTHDQLVELFGMEVEEAGEGFATVSATVHDGFLNSHKLAHGSFIFAVADVAFALAVNSLIDAVGVDYSLSLFRSTRIGDRITARCRIVHRGQRLIVVEFKVTAAPNRLLAKGQATALPLQTTRRHPRAG